MNNYNKKKFRNQLFLHLDGIVLIPTLSALNDTNILNLILEYKKFSINDISENIRNLNSGYLNVSLRLLRSLNLVNYKDTGDEFFNIYEIKDELIEFLKNKEIITSFNQILTLYNTVNFENNINTNQIFKKIDILKERKEILPSQLFYNLQGVIIGPLLSYLAFKNHINIKNDQRLEIVNFKDSFSENFYQLFKKINFIDEKFKLTDKGLFFITRSASYGVTSSYINTLMKIPELLIDDCSFIWKRDKEKNEIHVDRSLNVWGSGGSHKIYFKKIDKIIEDTFNQKIENQPKGVIDIGCGDGTFLEHINHIITTKTIRKDYLDTHPLFMIGTDINKAARISSRHKLNQSKVNNIIINGNISEPITINNILQKEYNVALSDFLNTRSFLDHNRIFEQPKHIKYNDIYTSGTFCYKGKIIQKNTLINNLIEHLRKWQPFINKHGLILLELHTINPEVTKEKIGKTLSLAYDATHGYSDQYLVEHKVFMECCKRANLEIDEDLLELFPNNDYPTVSINYIK